MAFMSLIWPGPLVVQAVHAAAKLGIADLLTDGPKPVDELAAAVSARPKALGRLLTALSSVGLFSVAANGNWENTPLSEFLREDHPQSQRPWAQLLGHPMFWRPMGELHHSIVTGRESFTKCFPGSLFEYTRENPEAGTLFNQAMAAQATGFMDKVTEAYDFSRFKTIADLGGGTGTMLSIILRNNPGLEAVLFELPEVIDEVDGSLVQEFGGRLTLITGSFFDSVPEGMDCYMTVRVIHDYPDEEAVKILKNIRKVMKPDDILLLLEGILDDNAPPNFAMMDMLMLVLAGSMERTKAEFRALLARGGFEISQIIRQGVITILECKISST